MSFKNDFWGGLGKSDKFVYAVAIVVGVPFGIYIGRGKINFVEAIWPVIVLPFLIAFVIRIVKSYYTKN